MNLRTVAALCVSGRSIYRHMAGVLAYGRAEDARTFSRIMPVVAHPPCRHWSKFLAHQAKAADPQAEMELGRWCLAQVLRHGGVLEHPAGSRLWFDQKLPMPGDESDPFCYSIYVEQGWFGYSTTKPTWVLVVGVPPQSLPVIPMRLSAGSYGTARGSSAERSRTMPGFASWLVGTARQTWLSMPCQEWSPSCAARA